MKTFKDLTFTPRLNPTPMMGFSGSQAKLEFPNGYAVSVIDDGYGSDQGLYELAVFGKDGHLDYSTPVTDDVLGNLTKVDVSKHMQQVQELQ